MTLRRRVAASGLDVEVLRQLGALSGSADEVLDLLEKDHAIGATRAYLRVLDLSDLEHLREIADKVLPAAKDLG